MAISFVTYTGDGSMTEFAFGAIPLLQKGLVPYADQLVVEVDAAVQPPSTYAIDQSGKTVTFVAAPASGASVKIERVTKSDDRYVDWTNATNLNQEQLNLDSDQLLFLSQEALDNATLTIRDNGLGQWDAEGNNIINVADGVGSNDAVNVQQLNSAIFGGTPGNVTGQVYFSSDDGTLSFNLPRLHGQAADDVNVFKAGVRLQPTVGYTVANNADGNSLDLTIAQATGGALIEIVYATGVLAASLAQGAVENDNIADGVLTPDKLANPGLRQLIINDPATGPAWSELQAADVDSALSAALPSKSLTELAVPTANLDMGVGNRIINLADPVSSLDGVNLQTLQIQIQSVTDLVSAAAAWAVGTICGSLMWNNQSGGDKFSDAFATLPVPGFDLGLYSYTQAQMVLPNGLAVTWNGSTVSGTTTWSPEGGDPQGAMDPDFVTAFNANGLGASGLITSTGGKVYSIVSQDTTSATWGNGVGGSSALVYFQRLYQFNFIRLA